VISESKVRRAPTVFAFPHPEEDTGAVPLEGVPCTLAALEDKSYPAVKEMILGVSGRSGKHGRAFNLLIFAAGKKRDGANGFNPDRLI
jgi:hypothetical protein